MTLDDLFSAERPLEKWNLQGFHGAPVFLFPEIGSTNHWMKERWTENSHGSIALADQQNSGRGRFQRVWRSPAGKNIYLSLLLKPETIPLTQWAHLTQVAAITLAKFFEEIGLPVHVKWPNDILFQGKKMCGILSERISRGGSSGLVLGMGININSTPEDFEGLDRLASSLRIELGRPVNREVFLQEFLNRLEIAFKDFESTGIEPWLTAWRGMKNFFGSPARLVQVDQVTEGIIQDICPDGSLLFLPDGQSIPIVIYSGDLEI
jgi:BirA family biotin operon repressor/biotin-[acetyl-CoA-carboxylase] ligase